MEHAPVADRIETPPTASDGGCPFPHGEAAVTTVAAVVHDDVAAPAGCPVAHAPAAAAPVVEAPAPVVEADAGARCPVPHVAAAQAAAATGGCPMLHGPDGVQRSKADLVVRRILRIKERPPGVSAASAYSTFQRSMLISATRCTLTYVVFPFVLPAAGFATGVGPMIGIVIGTIALACDTFTIRRFFAVDHKWRWHFSAIAFSIMCLLSVLLVQDVSHIVGNLVG